MACLVGYRPGRHLGTGTLTSVLRHFMVVFWHCQIILAALRVMSFNGGLVMVLTQAFFGGGRLSCV
jgi:hypothetical protein